MAISAVVPYPMPKPSDFPENKVSWKPEPKRSVLLIHDMQQYFLDAYLPGRPPVSELIENIGMLKRESEKLGIPVVYTMQPGGQNPADRALLSDFWGPGLSDTPDETRIADNLAPSEKDTIFVKWRYSAFKKTKLQDFLQSNGRDQVILCGIYAHIGCLLTACDAFMQDLKVFFVGDAMADFSPEHHKMAMDYVANRCGVTISTELLLHDLKSRDTNEQGLSLELVRKQISEILGESLTDQDDDENLMDRGFDSIRMMNLVEQWRVIEPDINFVRLAKDPTISAWWKALSLHE
jgi:bifunctional isochorismate lyase / aryl carrier protein